MSFQTVFFQKANNKIISVVQNQYIKSKFEKKAFCPDYELNEVNFFYFQSMLPIIPNKHKITMISPAHPPIITDETGIPLIYFTVGEAFIEARKSYKNIIVDLENSMGDNLYRANAVLEAQRIYTDTNFYCKVEEQYIPIISMVPEIKIFTNYKSLGLEEKKCATIKMSAGLLADPLGDYYSAPSRYGLFLGLPKTPYTVKLKLPAGFDTKFEATEDKLKLRDHGHNIVFQLRTITDETRSWKRKYIKELAHLIKSKYDCNIYSVGVAGDDPDAGADIINMCGNLSWMETVFLLRKASKVFCVDSAVLHLCHALDIKPYALYGRTQPKGVTGENPTDHDIGTKDGSLQIVSDQVLPLDVFSAAFPKKRETVLYPAGEVEDTSQHGDQKIIFDYFLAHPPVNKYLVDVGAYGKEMSNSYALLQAGWKGLLIEPHPLRCKIIKQEFAGLDYELIRTGVNDHVGKLPFYLHKVYGHNSFVKDWYPETLTGGKKIIKVLPLEMILDKSGVPIDFDFLTMDTEGLDYKIIKHLFEASKYRPKLIVTESTSYPGAEDFFKLYGYTQIAFTGEPGFGNYIFAKD
jgi:FkbM family methyltransferase